MNINKKTNKKGFTIVELVIVIAVIAILAAVLIPTFSSLVKTAQTSSDISLVKNLNTSLTTSEILDGKNETMTDALNDVKEDGYDVTKLTPTNLENDILWDEESNRFVLRIKDKYESCGSGVVVDESKLYKLWKIYNEIPALEDQTYSIYYIGEEVANAEVKVGFDSNVKVDSLVYTSDKEQTVIIRTDGGELSVNAPLGTVNHYGEGLVLNVEAIAGSSYHEYGYFPYADLKVGRIVIENGGKIETISTLDASDTVYVDVINGALIGNILSNSANLITNESAAEKVVTTTKIATKSELLEAIASNQAVVVLGSDIDLGNDQISLDHSVEIIGEGHTLTSTHKRFIQITTSDLEVKLSYLNMISVGAEYDTRAIAINSAASNVNLVINNVNIDSYNEFNAQQNKHNGAIVTLGSNHNISVLNSKIVMHLTADKTGYEVLATAKYGIKISSSNTVLNMENTIIDAPQCVCLVNNTGSTINAKKSTFIGRNNYNDEPADGVLFEQGSFIAPAIFENCDFVSAVEGNSVYCPIAAGTAHGSNEGAYVIIRNCRVDGVSFSLEHIEISEESNLTFEIQ